MAKTKQLTSWLQSTAVRVTRIHFVYIAVYIASIVIFDSWNLYTHTAIGNRWSAASILLVINTVCWYMARIKFARESIYIMLVIVVIIADIVFAATNVYWERGLASKAVLLFAVPIVTAATLRSRSTLLAVASLSTAAYSGSVVQYYNMHYGESFRVELYGYVGLFCALFFILAALLLVIIQPKDRF
jgi:hypothetical protein